MTITPHGKMGPKQIYFVEHTGHEDQKKCHSQIFNTAFNLIDEYPVSIISKSREQNLFKNPPKKSKLNFFCCEFIQPRI